MKSTLSNLILIVLLISSCTPKRITINNEITEKKTLEKIHLDLNEIDENGLIGPADGKRSVAYEFCVPIEKNKKKEVIKIDSSVRFFEKSRGRIGCNENYYLCIGEGGTKEVIINLAKLDYIKSIEPFYGE